MKLPDCGLPASQPPVPRCAPSVAAGLPHRGLPQCVTDVRRLSRPRGVTGLWDSAWAVRVQEEPRVFLLYPPSCPVSVMMEPRLIWGWWKGVDFYKEGAKSFFYNL